MKRVISFIILAALTLCAIFSALPSSAATPKGEAISNENDFLRMSASGSYYLSNDIIISSSYQNTFKGTFDGNGKKIKILDGANLSPFNHIENASFKNLTVEGVINVTEQVSYGGIAVEGYGVFENVTTKVGISAMVIDSFNSVGASQGCFIAKATGNSTFTKCNNEASITVVTQTGGSLAPKATGFGGFIGSVDSADSITFTECKNNASITSIEPRVSVGGFVGISLNSNLSFISCENNAIVIGGTDNNDEYHIGTGGFVGTLSGGSLSVLRCKNVADVQTYGSFGHTGGCVGRVFNVPNLTFDDFQNLRAIYNFSNGWEGVGGVVGIISDLNEGSNGKYLFKNCMNRGWVNGSMAGGIVGIEYSAHGVAMTFERCANTVPIKSLGSAYAGGIIGRTNGKLRSLSFTQCLNTGEITTNDGGFGVGGIVGNIGVENTAYQYTPLFEKCINTGNIVCKTTITTEGNVVAAGILARSPYIAATIKDCINLGTLSNSCVASNVAHIAPKYNSISHSVSNCSYLSTLGGASIWGNESAKSLTEIRSEIANALTYGLLGESEYYNYSLIKNAVDTVRSADTVAEISNGATLILLNSPSLITVNEKKAELLATLGEPIENLGGKYSADSYSAYISDYEKLKAKISSASNANELDAIDLQKAKSEAEAKLFPSLDIKKAELLALLGEKISNDGGSYTAESYEAYSETYLAIKTIIDTATDLAALNVIDVNALKMAAEASLIKVSAPEPSNPLPDSTDETNASTDDTEPQETEKNKRKSCVSAISLSSLAIILSLGATLTLKKKN